MLPMSAMPVSVFKLAALMLVPERPLEAVVIKIAPTLLEEPIAWKDKAPLEVKVKLAALVESS